MHELVANLAEQNEVVVCGSKLFDGERNDMMNVEWHVRLFLTVKAAPLALGAIALPDEAASVFPFLALVKRLALRGYAAFPVRV